MLVEAADVDALVGVVDANDVIVDDGDAVNICPVGPFVCGRALVERVTARLKSIVLLKLVE